MELNRIYAGLMNGRITSERGTREEENTVHAKDLGACAVNETKRRTLVTQPGTSTRRKSHFPRLERKARIHQRHFRHVAVKRTKVRL